MASLNPLSKNKKIWLISAGVVVLVALGASAIWLFSGGSTFVNRFLVAEGYCYADGQKLDGTYSPEECHAVPRWEKWCDLKGKCHPNDDTTVPQFGLCARTNALSTTYSHQPNRDQCKGGRDNKFYDTCEYTPGLIPPWRCSFETNSPPPVPAGSYTSQDDKVLGLCTVTNNINTSYLPHSLSFRACEGQSAGRFKINWYPQCAPAPGPLPWECQ